MKDESVASKLSKLADLHDSRVLSDWEFETLKAQLFGASRRHFVRQGGTLAGMVLVIVAVVLLLVGSAGSSSSSQGGILDGCPHRQPSPGRH